MRSQKHPRKFHTTRLIPTAMMYEYECEAMWSRQQPGWVADISIRDDPIRPPFRWKHHLPAWLPRLEVFWHVDHVDHVLQVCLVAVRLGIVIDCKARVHAGPDSHPRPRDP